MPLPTPDYYDDSSQAIAEAYRQRDAGNEVKLGLDPLSGQWYVRNFGPRPKPRGA